MVKEVSDRLVVFLVVIAVIVSFLGTYLVYINADNVPIQRTVYVNQQPNKNSDTAQVSVYVNENGNVNQNEVGRNS